MNNKTNHAKHEMNFVQDCTSRYGYVPCSFQLFGFENKHIILISTSCIFKDKVVAQEVEANSLNVNR